ncbi:MAG: dipeptidase [Anaerolineaceae bacterium]|nr:dipeptidase [Anaerolineaceae bacterium]
MDGTDIQKIAAEIHRESVVVDAHHDILIDVLKHRQKGVRGRLNSFWAPKLKSGGVNVQVMPVYVDTSYLPELALRVTLRMVEAFHADLDEDSSIISPAYSFMDVERLLAEGKTPAILALEGAEGLGNDIELFQLFYRLGMRVIGLTWNHRNAFADGTGEQATGGGLTKLGFEAVKEMNHLGMLIDLSHINEACFFDVLKTTNQTVIASHSNAKGVYDHPRNLTDEQIRALADNGGVMGLLIHPGLIDPKRPTIERCVDHLAYIIDLVGVDHVGIGSDFVEGIMTGVADARKSSQAMIDPDILDATISGLGRIDELSSLTEEMVRRGFSREEIEKILGANFMRVFRTILL